MTDNQRLILKTYAQMMRATEAVTGKMHRHLARSRLTISQFGVLEALYHLGPLCQRDIGEKILKTSGNITTVIDNLEKRGLVVREKDLSDRRFIIVRLTGEGHGIIDGIFPLHAKIAEEVFSILDKDELERLGELLKKLGKADGPSHQGAGAGG
jgi:MarR family 2-MHQ and catechol resistance regulon transcriptional repressor